MRVLCAAFALAAVACKGSADPPAGSEPSAASSTVGVAGLRVEAAPSAGAVAPIVRDAVAREAAQRRRLVVYVGATWCEPCQRFHQAAQRGDLDRALGDLTLLEFDLDRDGERLRSSGYVPQYIPFFGLPSADGTASGKQVEGAIKGSGAVAFIVPRLQELMVNP